YLDGFYAPENAEISHELALAVLRKENVLEKALDLVGLNPVIKKRIVFLVEGDSKKVGPDGRLVEIGQHGHRGGNGAKGTAQGMANSIARIVVGHYHIDWQKNGAVTVGTNTLLRQGYNDEGPSSWSQSDVLISPDGTIQS